MYDAVGRQLAGQRDMLGERRQRIEREGVLERDSESLRSAQSLLKKFERERERAKHGIDADRKTYEVWLGTLASQINDWQLKKMPELPDYEKYGTRSAMAALLHTASDVIDSD